MSNTHEAFKERDVKEILKRKSKYQRLLKFIRKLTNKESYSLENKNNSFLVYPCIEDKKTLDALLIRFEFSLPKKEYNYISILVTEELKSTLKSYREDIYFITSDSLDATLEKDIILIHDMSYLPLSILRNAHKIKIIDNIYFSDIEAEVMRKIFYYTFTKKEQETYIELSKKNFSNLMIKHSKKTKAYCFTTGPSFDTYKSINFDKNALKVICNSIVKNSDFLHHIGGADILTFADPVFHFGPSDYAETFRKDAINFIKENDAYIIVPDYNVPLLLSHYPSIKNNLIGMAADNPRFNFPSLENFSIKGSANILTLFMIPLASSIVDEVYMFGADGRNKEEKYFWKHSSTAQYNEKMESAFITHPSFFRDRDYEDYYDVHCSFLENLIIHGESKEKTYATISKSFIPVLEKRFFNLHLTREENMKNLNTIKNISRDEIETQNSNLNFAKELNNLYKHINYLKDNNYKIAIYGYGIIGKIFEKELQKQVTVICDKTQESVSMLKNNCPPKDLEKYNFDKLVICVLGREKEIIKTLDIDDNKIYQITVN